MTDNVTKLTRSSYVSISLMVAFCVGVFWVGDTTATISTKLEAIPSIQTDIRAMKDILGKANGEQLRMRAEINAIKKRLEVLETRPIPPPWFLERVTDLKRRLDSLEKR